MASKPRGNHKAVIKSALSTGPLALCLAALFFAGPAHADPAQSDLAHSAASIASGLAALCPRTPAASVDAHTACARGLRNAAFIQFVPNGLLFGADQPDRRLSKKQLTHLKPEIFQFLYLSLFSFTGRWSITMDERDEVGVIHIEAYFRNAMPPGEFPYPFWHNANKWNDYETANELKFYLNQKGEVFVITRSHSGSEANRGPFAHVIPPAFDGNWQWVDESGQLQPHVSLFSNLYDAANPYLPALDKAYRDFALEARKGTCLVCHSPSNKADVDHLILLQTPLHASGEIDNVLKEVGNGEMPEDDLGLRKEIAPELRATILRTGEAFRGTLHDADRWEAELNHWHPHGSE